MSEVDFDNMLKSNEVSTFGSYRMFRTDDTDNTDGILVDILQGPHGLYLMWEAFSEDDDDEVPEPTIQNILTLDDEVRFLMEVSESEDDVGESEIAAAIDAALAEDDAITNNLSLYKPE